MEAAGRAHDGAEWAAREERSQPEEPLGARGGLPAPQRSTAPPWTALALAQRQPSTASFTSSLDPGGARDNGSAS